MSAPLQRPAPNRVGSIAAQIGAGSALLVATIYVLRPFLVPLLWAGILAYVTWPFFQKLRTLTRRPRLSASLFTGMVAFGAGLLATWVLVSLARDANQLIAGARQWLDAGAPLPEWILSRPWLAERMTQVRNESVIDPTAVLRYATRYGSQVSGQLVNIAGGLASNVFKFAITMLALFFFYLDGERISQHARRLAGMAFPSSPQVLDHVGRVVRAVVFGLVGTALVQGLLAGLGFALFKVPSPVALGALTVVASFIPGGPVLVWGGAALGLLVGGNVPGAIGMTVYGVLVISSIDNLLRPLLISGGEVPIHFLIVLFGVLGGLAAFGMLGLFVGPVLLSVAFALVAEFGRVDEPSPVATSDS